MVPRVPRVEIITRGHRPDRRLPQPEGISPVASACGNSPLPAPCNEKALQCQLLTAGEVLDRFGGEVSRSTWDKRVEKGEAPHTLRLPNETLRVRHTGLEEWLSTLGAA